MDQKLQLMRNVSRDYSINWDSKGFSERISNPITSASVSIPEDLLLNSIFKKPHEKAESIFEMSIELCSASFFLFFFKI